MMIKFLSNWFPSQWSKWTPWHIILLPIAWVFAGIVSVRRYLYKVGVLDSHTLPVPVVVVGNINVGGAGKTPLVIYLVGQLKAQGFKPGVISRGYLGAANTSVSVTKESKVGDVGDEPMLIAQRANCPVFIGRDRVATAQALLNNHPECNIMISDDGLQHYRLGRDFEIVVVDGKVGFGNKASLPAGPLRESVSRLDIVDLVVVNGAWRAVYPLEALTKANVAHMKLNSGEFYNLIDNGLAGNATLFASKTITAVAGIGNPSRFFEQLKKEGLTFEQKVFPDHHAFKAEDFECIDSDVILMTEKDAVKCQSFAKANYWALPVSATLSGSIITQIMNALKVPK